MTQAILITDCLQRDFVGPIGRFDPLPNALHVGHEESLRLLGENPSQGPVARLLAWAHQQPDVELKVVHVRDWHDESDAHQRSHLEQFGTHCVKDSTGADFVFALDDAREDKRIAIVNATTLSNFIGAELGTVLDVVANQSVRVGLMGVWTEAKITYLAYDLRSRYPNFHIAVCSALTASSSRHNHFLALDQLERILGVEVVSSVGEFVEFLGGTTEETPLIGFSKKHPTIHVSNGLPLSDIDEKLARYLFRGCREITIKSLDGGFSGNRVLSVSSIDLHGHEEAPHVLKIGAAKPIGQERESFERIESVLGNSAPRVADFVDFADRGAIKYRYAAMGRGASQSFQKLYTAGANADDIARVLDSIFVDQLGRFYRAAELENQNLFEYYQFSSSWTDSVRRKVTDILGEAGNASVLEFQGSRRVANITKFYEHDLNTFPKRHRAHYFSYVHGDLNGANIIVDGQRNVWLIDFFHSHRGHVLKDLVKLENDVLFIFTQIDSEDTYNQALSFTDNLLAVEDLGRSLPVCPSDITDAALRRAWGTVAQLRSYYPELIKADREPTQLLIAQVRYAVHTLGFEESNLWQKRWALYATCAAAAQLRRRLSQAHELRIDWLPEQNNAPPRLGLTWLPGRRDAGRSLQEDVQSIVDQDVKAVVCLLSTDEFARYGVEKLLPTYRAANLDIHHLPVLDGTVPSKTEMQKVIKWIHVQHNEGHKVLVHCVGGLGRAGTVAACWLMSQGVSPQQAINVVRQSRSPRAIETLVQEEFINRFGDLEHELFKRE